MLRRFAHHLCPDWQRQRGSVAVRHNCGWLIETDPYTAGNCAGITEKPRIFVIVGRTGLAGCRQSEPQGGAGAGGGPASQDLFHELRGHPSRTWIEGWRGDMRREINGFVVRVVNSLDHVSLLTHT